MSVKLANSTRTTSNSPLAQEERGIAVDSINGGENEDEPEKKSEEEQREMDVRGGNIDLTLLCDLARKRPRLTVSPRYVTLYFTGSFALDAAIIVGGLPRPNWREQALSRADTSIRSGSVDVIVADRALEYKMGDAHMIIQAATCLELQSMVVLKRKGSPRRGDSADEESKRNSASDGPAKAKRPVRSRAPIHLLTYCMLQ
ncbi:hypothetical protein F2Q69_00032077 [Brassica cretica]|uniref:Uncharacterized protein n=1 Tax=Brassica cretica TaxID=69181 RepID=A0A8S9RUV4_BRACR|nr:hypothetical protein F2Q69_00032077 [Brassica cretica]